MRWITPVIFPKTNNIRAASDILVKIRKNTGTWYTSSLLVQKNEIPQRKTVVHIKIYARVRCLVIGYKMGKTGGF